MTISTANGITTDDFTTNTSASYQSTHINGGSNGTWTWDTANKRLIPSGGGDAALAYTGLSIWNGYAEADLDQATQAGVFVMYTDTNNLYQCYVNDASVSSNPNTFTLYDGGNYTTLASGSIPTFTRGTRHTIRLEVNRYDLTVSFDGVVVGIAGATAHAAPGNAGMLGGTSGQPTRYLRFAVGDQSVMPLPVPPHQPADGHCIYEYISPDVGQSVWGPRLDKFAAGGFKLVLNYYLIYGTTANMLAYINYAASKGMKVIIALDRTFLWNPAAIQANVPIMYGESGNKSTDATFTPYVVNQVKNLPGTWGYYVGDEVAFASKAAMQTHISVVTGADNSKPTLQIQSDYSSAVHRLTTDWTGCAGVIGDDVYPYPDAPNPTVENVAYGIGKYCAFHGGIGQAIALQCYSKDGINDPTLAMMQGWLASVQAYMQPRLILWFAYPDLLLSPNPTQLWNDLVAAINPPSLNPLKFTWVARDMQATWKTRG